MTVDRETAAYIAQLEDTVVMAAALWFEEIKPGSSEAGYASECLHEMASDVIKRTPRLTGGYKGAEL